MFPSAYSVWIHFMCDWSLCNQSEKRIREFYNCQLVGTSLVVPIVSVWICWSIVKSSLISLYDDQRQPPTAYVTWPASKRISCTKFWNFFVGGYRIISIKIGSFISYSKVTLEIQFWHWTIGNWYPVPKHVLFIFATYQKTLGRLSFIDNSDSYNNNHK